MNYAKYFIVIISQQITTIIEDLTYLFNIPDIAKIFDNNKQLFYYKEIIFDALESYMYQDKTKETEDNTIYDEIVKIMINEADKLSHTLVRMRDKGDYNLYITIIKSLKEILSLIQHYEWKQCFNETIIDSYTKEISIWEENAQGQIRNKKSWITKQDIS
jgi:metal-responsive CopG/Arc/MetJ family transcriptional regulator